MESVEKGNFSYSRKEIFFTKQTVEKYVLSTEIFSTFHRRLWKIYRVELMLAVMSRI